MSLNFPFNTTPLLKKIRLILNIKCQPNTNDLHTMFAHTRAHPDICIDEQLSNISQCFQYASITP